LDTGLGLLFDNYKYFGNALLENILQNDGHVGTSEPSSRVYDILQVENSERGRGTVVVTKGA